MKRRTLTVLLLSILMVLSPALGAFADTETTDNNAGGGQPQEAVVDNAEDEDVPEAVEEPAAEEQQAEEAVTEEAAEVSDEEAVPEEKPVMKSPAESSTCDHSDTYTYIEFDENAGYEAIDNREHRVTGSGTEHTECCICGETLHSEKVEDVTDTQAHDYNDDGVCTLCGHFNTCKHENRDSYSDKVGNIKYTEIEGNNIEHQAEGEIYNVEYCEDCEQILSRTLLTDPTPDFHEFKDGVCTLCGHINTCAHEDTYTDIELGEEVEYENIGDEAVHLVTGEVYEVEYCEECGEEISRRNIGEAEEEHYFENGVCEDCGYESNWSADGKYYYGDNGEAVKGWLPIGEEWYFFDKTTGEKKTGWLKSGSNWYYLDTEISERTGFNGAMVTGRKKIGGKYYFFNENSGIMKTGWREEKYTIDGDSYSDWYYYNSSGAQLFGWQKIKNVWYYFEEDYDEGYMATGSWYITKSQKVYMFDDNGKWLQKYAGWFCEEWEDEYGDGWYKNWYYFKAGTAVKGWQKISGTWYYFDSDSIMLTNDWAKDGKYWCWMGSNGKMVKKKWILDDGDWYYLDGSGHMAVSKWMKDSKGWCWLQADGRMLTEGWAKDSKGWCWIADDGYMPEVTKWVEYEGDMYYIIKGYRVDNKTITIDGESYTFDSEGRCLDY